MAWQLTKNLAQSTLASGYTAGDSSISVQSGDGAKFPTSGDFMLGLNDPPDFFLRCTARSTDTLTVDTSGAESSTAINEASGIKVTQVITAGVLSDLLAAAGGGGSGLVLLEQHTASSSAELDFTSCISSAYDEYEIHLINVLPATNGSTLAIQVSTDGGATYDTGANYGMESWEWVPSGATDAYGSNTGLTYVSPTGGNACYNVAIAGGVVGRVQLYSPLNTTSSKLFEGRTHFIEQSTGNWWNVDFGGQYMPTTAVNAFRILFSSGNITSGTVRVYGLAK